MKNTIARVALFISLFIGILAANLHQYYVGLTEIEYKAERERLEVSIKLFTDDLEETLQRRGGAAIKVSLQNAEIDSLLNEYLQDYFRITVDAEARNFQFVGKENNAEDGVTWCYLLFENIENAQKITLSNELLMSTFEEQTHLVHFKADKQKASALLQLDDSTAEFSL